MPRLSRSSLYAERNEPGTQAPAETLEKKSGACRDFAMVFIEAARYLGFGARFVSGYLYDPALDKGDATQAIAATHAWAEVYLPGAGWIEYDPTDVLIGGESLIRVAVTRDPSQGIPISGSYIGNQDFLGMTVEVTVTHKGMTKATSARQRRAHLLQVEHVHTHAVRHDDVARLLPGGAGAQPFRRDFHVRSAALPRPASAGPPVRVEVTRPCRRC